MNPNIGDQVHVAVEPYGNGGVDHAPAIVVAVAEELFADVDERPHLVHVQLLPNGPGVRYLTDVPLFADRAAAQAAIGRKESGLRSAYVAWWPAGTAERAAAVSAMAELVTADTAGGDPDPALV